MRKTKNVDVKIEIDIIINIICLIAIIVNTVYEVATGTIPLTILGGSRLLSNLTLIVAILSLIAIIRQRDKAEARLQAIIVENKDNSNATETY